MKPKILIVDDRAEVLTNTANALRAGGMVEVITANGLRSAIQTVSQHFVVAAFVDLYIENSADPGNAGRLCSVLQKLRPTAKRIVFTQKTRQGWRDLLQLCDPVRGVVDGIWERANVKSLGDMITEYVEAAKLRSDVAIDNLSAAVISLKRKVEPRLKKRAEGDDGIKREFPRVTEGEVHFVIAQLLQTIGDVVSEDAISQMSLTELGRGKSSSCVFRGRAETRRGDKGILCILKMGPRYEIAEEIRAFDRFVRFSRSTFRRVEVLSHCLADAIGGICYSFAGTSPAEDGIESFQDVLERGDLRRAISILRTEMNPSQKEWFKKESARSGRTMTGFFSSAYELSLPNPHIELPATFARQFMLAPDKVGGMYIDQPPRWTINGPNGDTWVVDLLDDSDVARLTLAFTDYRSCIVHGDMNGENLIVPKDDGGGTSSVANPGEEVILIDYRQTQRGPVFCDFAALEATARLRQSDLSRVNGPDGFAGVAALIQKEVELLDRSWNGPIAYETERSGPFESGGSLWESLSYEIVQLARGNFETPGADKEAIKTEYAVTCVLYGLRLLKINRLSAPYQEAARARVLVWMASLLQYLRRVLPN